MRNFKIRLQSLIKYLDRLSLDKLHKFCNQVQKVSWSFLENYVIHHIYIKAFYFALLKESSTLFI